MAIVESPEGVLLTGVFDRSVGAERLKKEGDAFIERVAKLQAQMGFGTFVATEETIDENRFKVHIIPASAKPMTASGEPLPVPDAARPQPQQALHDNFKLASAPVLPRSTVKPGSVGNVTEGMDGAVLHGIFEKNQAEADRRRDETVKKAFAALTMSGIKEAIPAAETGGDGLPLRGSEFYEAFLKSGTDQIRALEAAFRRAGAEEVAARCAQEAARRDATAQQLAQSRARSEMQTQKARLSTPPKAPAAKASTEGQEPESGSGRNPGPAADGRKGPPAGRRP